MVRYIKGATAAGLLVAATAPAAFFGDVVREVDPRAQVRGKMPVYEVVTSAQRVTPHEAPFTTMVAALCQRPETLQGLDKVVIFNRHGVKGVEFWHYDEFEDLSGACAAIADGSRKPAMFAVMR